MSESSNWLAHDHKQYDEVLAECEKIAEAGLWEEALKIYKDFVEDLKLHMRMEDEVLYPLFEAQHGDPRGEIACLSEEHDLIVQLLQDLAFVIKRKDYEHFLASLKPLHKVLNQHNDSEEYVFLTMEDDSILMRREEIMSRLNDMQEKAGRRIWDI